MKKWVVMNADKLFAAVSAATVAAPWVILWAGRGPVLLSVLCVGALTVLLWTVIAALRRKGQLATWGTVVLILLFVSIMIVPSLAR
jgi:hypothetical protein